MTLIRKRRNWYQAVSTSPPAGEPIANKPEGATKPMAGERNHSISCGGFHLIRDGQLHMAEIGAACRYDGMSYKNVQQFWGMLRADPRFRDISQRYADELAAVMHDVGNALGLQKGKISAQDLADIEQFASNHSAKPATPVT